MAFILTDRIDGSTICVLLNAAHLLMKLNRPWDYSLLYKQVKR